MSSLEEIEARLTGPGGMFELEDGLVLGEPMRVLKNRARSLRALLAQSSAHGDKEFLVYRDRRISYAEHAALVASVARALREEYGVGKGDRVAILAANCPEWIVAFFAATSLGAIAVGLNGWWSGDEIGYGLQDSEPKLLVADRKRLARLEGRDPGVPVVEIETGFGALERFAPDAALPDAPIDEDDPACILYTSGTTGRPKGAVCSHRTLCGVVGLQMLHSVRLMMLAAESGAAPSAPPRPTCALLTTPFFHVSGLFSGVVMMLAAGAKIVLREARFEAGDVMELIEREQVTAWTAMGTMAYRLLHHPDLGKRDLSSLENIGSGGAPLSADLQRKLREHIPSAASSMGLGYGLTESGAIATINGGQDLIDHPDSAGRPMPSIELEIRDPDGKALPEGVEGEIHLRSPLLMLEYWRKPDATREVFAPARWLRTGDIGRVEDGRLFVNSRARDLILRGGENIYPIEIEQRLELHASVQEAAVVGVDHEEYGQEVKAFVIPVAGESIDTATLAAWVAEGLAAFKVPSLWEIRSEALPRNASGKVMKHVLTGQAENTLVAE